MSRVKERILGAITVMRDDDAERIWDIIQRIFGDGYEEFNSTEDKIYEQDDEEYHPYMMGEEALKDLLEDV